MKITARPTKESNSFFSKLNGWRLTVAVDGTETVYFSDSWAGPRSFADIVLTREGAVVRIRLLKTIKYVETWEIVSNDTPLATITHPYGFPFAEIYLLECQGQRFTNQRFWRRKSDNLHCILQNRWVYTYVEQYVDDIPADVAAWLAMHELYWKRT